MSANELRIKIIDYYGRLEWMFCDLERLKSIQDLKEQVADKYVLDVDNFQIAKNRKHSPSEEWRHCSNSVTWWFNTRVLQKLPMRRRRMNFEFISWNYWTTM